MIEEAHHSPDEKKYRNAGTAVGLAGCALYLLALLFPQPLWGIHYTAFLPPFWQWTTLAVAVSVVSYFHFQPDGWLIHWLIGLLKQRWIFIGILTLMAGLCFWNYPIATNAYGDSELFSARMGESTTEYSEAFLEQLLSVDVRSPKSGNLTVLSGIRLLSYAAGVSHRQAYAILGAFSGMAFLLIWLSFVNHYFSEARLRVILVLLGLTAPFSQLFFGYQEIYAPAIPALTAYLCGLLLWFKNRKTAWLWVLPILLLFCLKLHSSSYLLIPSLLMVYIYAWLDKKGFADRFFSWKNACLFLFLPAMVGGGVVYFFVLNAFAEPRFLGPDVDIYTRLFLPIKSSMPPLDRYSLLHFNHFTDYFNLLFLWSGGMLGLFLLMLQQRAQIRWQRPEVIVTGSTLVLYGLLYFMINPLMSMPYDWDYFSLPGPVLFLFVAALSSQIQHRNIGTYAMGAMVAFSILGVPRFAVNASEEALSQRLESLGVHVFKTYWIRSAGDIAVGIDLGTEGSERLARYESVLTDLEPHALKGNDEEYANLAWRTGKLLRSQPADYEKALNYHLLAQQYDPELPANYIGLMECSFVLKRYFQAWEYSQKLVDFQYPNQKKALLIAIQCALWAEEYDSALQHCETYADQWPEEFILYIRDNLRNQTNLPVLKNQFQS